MLDTASIRVAAVVKKLASADFVAIIEICSRGCQLIWAMVELHYY